MELFSSTTATRSFRNRSADFKLLVKHASTLFYAIEKAVDRGVQNCAIHILVLTGELRGVSNNFHNRAMLTIGKHTIESFVGI